MEKSDYEDQKEKKFEEEKFKGKNVFLLIILEINFC